MVGVEIDMVVKDSLSALALYEAVFGAERVEATSYAVGMNEAVFTLYGSRFHLLDENPEYGLVAPKEVEGKPMWLNVLVEDIQSTYDRAKENGFAEIQPLTNIPEMGITNAVLVDPYGYVWMLHQIHEIVSFEDRLEYLENTMNIEK